MTEDIYVGRSTKATRRFPVNLHQIARRKLDMINAAHALIDLYRPPSNRLERLQGTRQEEWSIRINDQYRICFRFEPPHASDVTIEDYH